MNLKERTYLWYLSVLRIYVGYYLFFQGIGKFHRNFPKGDWIGRQIGDIASLDLYPWYKTFLQNYVVPHSELFGYLVMVGEIAVGVCLLLGLFTRLSALVGLFMLIQLLSRPWHGTRRRDVGPTADLHHRVGDFRPGQSRSHPRSRRLAISRRRHEREKDKMKLPGSATLDGTDRYRKRFAGKLPEAHFRQITKTLAVVHRHGHLSRQL